MIHLGNVPAGSTLYIPWATYDANGASVTMTGLATSDILIYKNGSTTQRSSTAGFTLLDTDGIDFDGVTGLHGVSIDLSDNTDAGFYSAGAFYWVVISTVTVAGQTITLVAATFRLVAAESVAGTPKADVSHFGGTAGTFNGGRPEVNTTHAAGTAWGSGAISAGAIASDAITAAKIADGAIDAATFASGALDAVWSTATRALTDKAGFSLSSAGVQAIWDALTSALATANSIGKLLVDNVNATISSRSTYAGADTSGTTTLLSRLSATRAGYLDNLSAGAVALEASVQSVLTKLLKYVQLIVRKDAAIATDNATELTAINANGGSGAGGFANTTDSNEALRDRGDAAWTTATGFSTHSAADVWAVGTRTLTSFGTLVADVWAYATRVLTGYGTLTAPLDAAGTRAAVGLGSADLDTKFAAQAAALAVVDTNVDDLKSGIILGAAATGTLSTTQATSDLIGYANDQLIGRVIIWLTGNCEGEATDITDYASASGLLTFTALTTAPGNGDTFKIV